MSIHSSRNNSYNNRLTHLEVYKKAIELFKTSRLLATYITDNKDIGSMNTSKQKSDRYSLQLVMDSMSLVPDIAEVHTTFDVSMKRYKIRRMKKTLTRLHKYCDYIEKRYEHAKDYIHLLRQEIIAYRKAHTSWENNLFKNS
ncbi:hypothetical protein NBRC110019_29120 [Neptunitalea chrysea]|uniref:Uncharacterized protein n=1 Tax=Neptunitalea chrysea TaxID=1647581 RepID=A0A9W6EW67_9FLAO|nr:hypothetical protein [Neptunitalea chrysea]GLB53871.1 hypothetical protein NBRC110019_29120 [Neptunitalea chrysea]